MENANLKTQIAKRVGKMKARLGRSGHKPTPSSKPAQAPWSDPQKAVAAEFARTLKAWAASDEGKAFVASAPSLTLDGLKETLGALVRGPLFGRTRELNLAASRTDASFMIKSAMVGLAGMAELFVGVYGSIGYIFDIDGGDSDSAIYILVAAAEGLEGDLDLALQGGLWTQSVADLGHTYYGVEVAVDEVIGLSGFGLGTEKDSDLLAALLLDLDVGIADGADGMEFYMVTFSTSANPVEQPVASNMLMLNSLTCENTSDAVGHDEVTLRFYMDGSSVAYHYPTQGEYSMSDDQSDPTSNWNLFRSVWFNSKVEVDVYDGGSKIANFTLNRDNFGGYGTTNMIYPTYDEKSGLNEVKYYLAAYLLDLSQ